MMNSSIPSVHPLQLLTLEQQVLILEPQSALGLAQVLHILFIEANGTFLPWPWTPLCLTSAPHQAVPDLRRSAFSRYWGAAATVCSLLRPAFSSVLGTEEDALFSLGSGILSITCLQASWLPKFGQ